MPNNSSFDGIFFVKSAPTIRFDDGLFFVCYDVGNVHCEFVMRPNIYLKAFRAGEKAVAQFANRSDGSVSGIRSKGKAKASH